VQCSADDIFSGDTDMVGSGSGPRKCYQQMQMCCNKQSGDLASFPGHVGGGKSGLVSTICACANYPTISWGIYHIPSFTNHNIKTFRQHWQH